MNKPRVIIHQLENGDTYIFYNKHKVDFMWVEDSEEGKKLPVGLNYVNGGDTECSDTFLKAYI